jgi:hypothetical protein
MNWSEMTTSWDEMKALVHAHWPKLTDDVLNDIDGDRVELRRALQRDYAFTPGHAENAICEFKKDVRRPGAVK